MAAFPDESLEDLQACYQAELEETELLRGNSLPQALDAIGRQWMVKNLIRKSLERHLSQTEDPAEKAAILKALRSNISAMRDLLQPELAKKN